MENPDELENEYHHLLEQMFQLKQHGNLSFFEMDSLTSEDRAWWLVRLKRFQEEQEQASKGGGNVPSVPSQSTSAPHVSRPSAHR